ncbi:hypothetical protein V6N12_035391 [Hibiscus sabdariffa]|uniref:Uncharacterized protein n=1 Tax=Hibiscus sabdariffa TaxID=183260 RepID=A0ABR2EMX4_9ROSI
MTPQQVQDDQESTKKSIEAHKKEREKARLERSHKETESKDRDSSKGHDFSKRNDPSEGHNFSKESDSSKGRNFSKGDDSSEEHNSSKLCDLSKSQHSPEGFLLKRHDMTEEKPVKKCLLMKPTPRLIIPNLSRFSLRRFYSAQKASRLLMHLDEHSTRVRKAKGQARLARNSSEITQVTPYLS